MKSIRISAFHIYSFIALLFCTSTYANILNFKYSIDNNKYIALYSDKKNITYTFEKKEKPEIVVKKDRKEVNFDLENPDGGGLSSSIEIRNGNYSYQLISVIDKISERHNSTTLLNVIYKGRILRNIYCIPNSEYGSLTSSDPAYLGSMQ
ncbi:MULTISPECIES: hypothetical protein [unclassified Enterobacter]|jgi:hypothetical protein|uniref:hypothetical protein n=1 Tax=unclassified Enterobacter TaxID=2608935 RepID=UPI0015CE78C2|nr:MULTISPECIES: hypothetical protein [unclassified Enterobacter]MBB3307564.1 hypothetical protein [Enterobacter sp. Sphag1F]NYI16348.1 hypothetical protein [Enterobacter sp. Sphag71]